MITTISQLKAMHDMPNAKHHIVDIEAISSLSDDGSELICTGTTTVFDKVETTVGTTRGILLGTRRNYDIDVFFYEHDGTIYPSVDYDGKTVSFKVPSLTGKIIKGTVAGDDGYKNPVWHQYTKKKISMRNMRLVTAALYFFKTALMDDSDFKSSSTVEEKIKLFKLAKDEYKDQIFTAIDKESIWNIDDTMVFNRPDNTVLMNDEWDVFDESFSSTKIVDSDDGTDKIVYYFDHRILKEQPKGATDDIYDTSKDALIVKQFPANSPLIKHLLFRNVEEIRISKQADYTGASVWFMYNRIVYHGYIARKIITYTFNTPRRIISTARVTIQIRPDDLLVVRCIDDYEYPENVFERLTCRIVYDTSRCINPCKFGNVDLPISSRNINARLLERTSGGKRLFNGFTYYIPSMSIHANSIDYLRLQQISTRLDDGSVKGATVMWMKKPDLTKDQLANPLPSIIWKRTALLIAPEMCCEQPKLEMQIIAVPFDQLPLVRDNLEKNTPVGLKEFHILSSSFVQFTRREVKFTVVSSDQRGMYFAKNSEIPEVFQFGKLLSSYKGIHVYISHHFEDPSRIIKELAEKDVGEITINLDGVENVKINTPIRVNILGFPVSVIASDISNVNFVHYKPFNVIADHNYRVNNKPLPAVGIPICVYDDEKDLESVNNFQANIDTPTQEFGKYYDEINDVDIVDIKHPRPLGKTIRSTIRFGTEPADFSYAPCIKRAPTMRAFKKKTK